MDTKKPAEKKAIEKKPEKEVWLVTGDLTARVSLNPMDRQPTPEEMGDFDVKHLGHRLPGNPHQRQVFLQELDRLVKEYGKEEIWKWRERLLLEAQFVVDEEDFWQG